MTEKPPANRRGRPPLTTHPSPVSVRLSHAELAEIRAAAAREHRTPTAWLRAVALESLALDLAHDGATLGRDSAKTEVRFDTADLAALDESAARCGMKRSPWIRAAALRRLRA